ADALERSLVGLGSQEATSRLAAAGKPASAVVPLALSARDLTSHDTGVRLSVATVLPILFALFLMPVMALSDDRLAGAKERRTLEPMLSLPIRRSDLVLGMGGAASILGLAQTVLVVAPLTVLVALAATNTGAGANDI